MSQIVPVSFASLSRSHYILSCLAHLYSKMRAFPLVTRQPCLNSVWTSLHLCHSHWLCSLRFQTHILLWLWAKEPGKTSQSVSISVQFTQCGLLAVQEARKKLNKKKDEICFTSVLSGKIPAWGYELHRGLTEVPRFHQTCTHTLWCFYTVATVLLETWKQYVCSSSAILYTN